MADQNKAAVASYPERIYLQGANEHDDGTDPYAVAERGELTWCQDSINKFDVEYVRADIAAPAVPAVDALTRYSPTADVCQNEAIADMEVDNAMGSYVLLADVQALLAAAPADPEQAKLDSLAQAGLAAALENHAKGGQSNWHVMPPFAAPAGLLCIDRKQLGSIVTDLLMDGARAKSVQFRDGVTFGVLGLHEKTLALAGVQPSIAGPAKGGNTKPDSSNLAAPEATSEQHPDDIAVDRFAAAMKAKMAKSRANGRDGWDQVAACTDKSLADKLMEHTKKGDPVDVANFCMMLHQRNQDQIDIAIGTLRGASLDFAKRVASMWVPVESGEQMGGAQVARAEWRDKLRWSKANTDYHGYVAFTPGQLEHFVSMLIGNWEPKRTAEGEATERKPLTDAARDVLAERQRQVDQEGWTPDHDDKYKHGQMRYAAAAYVLDDHKYNGRKIWPWPLDWWKPRNERRNLVKAGALILAEIERMDRIEQHHGITGGGK